MNKIKQLRVSLLLLLCLIATLTACNKKQQKPQADNMIMKTGQYSATISTDSTELEPIILDFPTAIRIYYGSIINEVAFAYGNDEVFIGNNIGNREEYELKEHEYITEVSGNFMEGETVKGKTTIFTELCFITSSQDTFRIQADWNDEMYGAKKTFQYKAQEGNAIFCLYGTKNPAITSIGFFEKKLPDINVENINTTLWITISAVVLLALIILSTILILKKKRYRF